MLLSRENREPGDESRERRDMRVLVALVDRCRLEGILNVGESKLDVKKNVLWGRTTRGIQRKGIVE